MRIIQKLFKSLLVTGMIITLITPWNAKASEITEIDNDFVQTVDFSKFNKQIDENDELYQMLKKGLLNANKYALTTWFNEKKNLDEDQGEYYNLYKASGNSGVNEYVYRFPATQAFGIAVSLRTGIYDEAVTGVSAEQAKEITLKLVTSVAYAHKANGGNFRSWGDDWQAAHWAFYAGYTAWLYWDELSAEDQALIKNMIIHEANRFCNTNAVYWKTANGNELYEGDSKIEEDGWNAELLNLAAEMFPKHENAPLWEYRFIEYQLAAFAIPSMTQSNEMIHGRAAKDWIFGYNVNENGTVINHGIVHPTYNAASTGVNTSLVNSLLHEEIPLAAKYNLDRLYEGLSKVDFKVEDGYKEPGGTIYRDGSYEIYCPQGNDWGGEIYDVYVNIDVSALVYGYGDDSYNWAKLHLQKVLDQQIRHDDGHTYKDNSENSYAGKEEAISMRLGCAFMTYWLGQQKPVKFANYSVDYPASDLPPLDENTQRIFASEGIYVRDGGSADTNYYPSDMVEVKKDGLGYYREGYIKYDLNDVNTLPQKAEIYIPAVNVGKDVATAKIKHAVELVYDDSWSEEKITYNNKPQSNGTVLLEYEPTQDGVTLDVTEYVKKAYASDKKLSFRIYALVSAMGDTFVKYGSPRQADLNMRPQMLLTYSDKAELSLIGEENIKTNQAYNVILEGNNLHLGNDYSLVITYDNELLQLDSVDSANQAVKVTSFDKTYSNKATVKISSSGNPSQLVNLKFLSVGKGNTEISVNLIDNGSKVLTAEKEVNITQAALSGSFISTKRPETINLPLDDTTVQPTTQASAHGSRDEMDMKTYGGNAWATRQTFIKFPLPSDNIDEIDSIKLNLNVKKLPNVTGSINMRFQYFDDNTWAEDTLNWDSKPAATKTVDGAEGNIPAADQNTLADVVLTPDMIGKYFSVDVTEKAKELLKNGQKEISVFVYSATYGNLSCVFSTKESANENIRPFISTSYKKTDNFALNLDAVQDTVKRYEKVTLNLSADQLSDIADPMIDVTFPEFIAFDKAEALNSSIKVETVESLKNTVRLKLSKTNRDALNNSGDLISLSFDTIGSGNANVRVEALDEDQNLIFAEKAITVENTLNKNLDIMLSGESEITLNQSMNLQSLFTGIVPGTKYNVELKYNTDVISVENLYAANQNLEIQPVEGNNNQFILTAIESDQPYLLELTIKDNKVFETETIALLLNDEDNTLESSHTLKFVETVDKTDLQTLYDNCLRLNENDYTKSSWNNLQAALKNAKAILDKEDATKEEVENVLYSLRVALNELKRIDSNGNNGGSANKPSNPDITEDTDNESTNNGHEAEVETPNTGVYDCRQTLMLLSVISFAAMLYLKRRNDKEKQSSNMLN